MNRRMNLLCLLAVAATAACSGTARMNVGDDLQIWRAAHSSASAGGSVPIDVGVVGAPSMELVVGAPVQPGQPAAPAIPLVPLASPDGRVPAGQFGIIVLGGGDAIREMLEQRLRGAGARPTVHLVVEPGASDVVVRAGAFFGRNHQATVSLVGTFRDGRTIVASGVSAGRSSAGHLAWAIPALLVTGLTGLIFISPTMHAINTGIEEQQFIEAADHAAENFATQLMAQQAAPAAPQLSQIP